jgi:16S rRNA (guanine(966)-N(2))-methyltransferase RsmD
MRIIGGECRGRRLGSFKGIRIRPTSDKVREAVFNILPRVAFGERFKKVLDLFAGTGAMGIEALSRGAKEAAFVDPSRVATGLIRKNLLVCPVGEARVIERSAEDALRSFSKKGETFDLIFIDPPYESGLAGETLCQIDGFKTLSEQGVIVAETSKRSPLDARPSGITCFDSRQYGDTVIYLFRHTGAISCQDT